MWKRLVFAIGIIIVGINTGSGPTLPDLEKIKCNSTHPNICLPYGRCCAAHEFCHSGLCESCFSKDIKEKELLVWCRDHGQHDVTLMRHNSCSLACQAKFNSSALCAVATGTTQNQFQEMSCPDDRPNFWPPALCCKDDEFDLNGSCHSCFPDDISDLDLLNWCRTGVNTTYKRHKWCNFACSVRFKPSQILAVNDSVDGWMVAFIIAAIACAGLLATVCWLENQPVKRKRKQNRELVATNDNMEPPIDRRLQRSISKEERRVTLLSVRDNTSA